MPCLLVKPRRSVLDTVRFIGSNTDAKNTRLIKALMSHTL